MKRQRKANVAAQIEDLQEQLWHVTRRYWELREDIHGPRRAVKSATKALFILAVIALASFGGGTLIGKLITPPAPQAFTCCVNSGVTLWSGEGR